jgi:hypothetical protein
MQPIGNQFLKPRQFKLKPRFTVVHHPLREKFSLSFTTYAIIDSVHQLSHRPDHPWCSQSKSELARFLDISERSAYRSISEGLEKGLMEKNDRGDLRSTRLWIERVVLFDSENSQTTSQNSQSVKSNK